MFVRLSSSFLGAAKSVASKCLKFQFCATACLSLSALAEPNVDLADCDEQVCLPNVKESKLLDWETLEFFEEKHAGAAEGAIMLDPNGHIWFVKGVIDLEIACEYMSANILALFKDIDLPGNNFSENKLFKNKRGQIASRIIPHFQNLAFYKHFNSYTENKHIPGEELVYLLNFLIGNCDTHLGNLGVIKKENGIEMSCVDYTHSLDSSAMHSDGGVLKISDLEAEDGLESFGKLLSYSSKQDYNYHLDPFILNEVAQKILLMPEEKIIECMQNSYNDLLEVNISIGEETLNSWIDNVTQRHQRISLFAQNLNKDLQRLSIYSPLYHFAILNDLETIENLIHAGYPLDTKSPAGKTALYWASFFKNTKIAKALIQAGADVNIADDTGTTPLHLALSNKQLYLVDRLIDAGAKTGITMDENGNTAIHLLAKMSGLNNSLVDKIVEKTSNIDAVNQEGKTALQIALDSPYKDEYLAVALIKAGANTDTVDKDNNTLLHLAADSSNSEAARLLIQAGLKIDAVNNRGQTPMDRAKASMHTTTEVQKILFEASVDQAIIEPDSLHQAIIYNDMHALNTLIRLGADTNAISLYEEKDNEGSIKRKYNISALELSARLNNIEALDALISAGANLNLVSDGDTALHGTNNVAVAEKLLLAGADPNIIDDQGMTPLDKAAMNGNLDMAKLLVKHGAKISIEINPQVRLPRFYNPSNELYLSLLEEAGANTWPLKPYAHQLLHYLNLM